MWRYSCTTSFGSMPFLAVIKRRYWKKYYKYKLTGWVFRVILRYLLLGWYWFVIKFSKGHSVKLSTISYSNLLPIWCYQWFQSFLDWELSATKNRIIHFQVRNWSTNMDIFAFTLLTELDCKWPIKCQRISGHFSLMTSFVLFSHNSLT